MTAVESLLSELNVDGNVEVENLDKYLHKRGVIVKVHIGRMRGNIELSPKLLGLKMTKEIRLFFSKYAKNGSISFLDKETVSELERIENRVRMKKVRMALGDDLSYMPLETYREFANYLEEQRSLYFAKRDEILDRWDQLRSIFMQELDDALKLLHSSEEAQKIFQAVMRKYPTKDEFRDSFYMRASLKAFPVMENLHLLDSELSEEVKESAIKENLRLVREMVGVCLNDIFGASNKVHEALTEKRKIEPRTKGSVLNTIKVVKKNNVMNHRKVDMLVKKLQNLIETKELYDAIELAEEIMATSYGYAKELDLSLDIRDSNLPEDDLEVLYKAYVA